MRPAASFGAAAAVIAALAAANLWMAANPVDVSPSASTRQARDGAADTQLDPGKAPDLSQLSLVQANSRPLFAKNRKPWSPPQAAKAAKAKGAAQPGRAVAGRTPPPDLRLIGVSISGGSARALLLSGASPDPVWVAAGESFGNWKVSEITERFVTVQQADQTVSLDLYPETPQVQ